MNSYKNYYVLNEHDNEVQFSRCTISSETMTIYSHPTSLLNQLKYLLSDHVNELIWYQLCPK